MFAKTNKKRFCEIKPSEIVCDWDDFIRAIYKFVDIFQKKMKIIKNYRNWK
jgi:hypothetical protein